MAAKKDLTPEEMMEQANQHIAQMEMDAQRRIDSMVKSAEEKRAEADRVLSEAKLTAANIPHLPRKTLDQELAEAAKLTMTERMKKQFGPDSEMVNVAIPIDNESRERVMSVAINGWEYPFRRGEMYSIPKDMLPLIMGSVHDENEAAKAAGLLIL